MLLLPSLSWEDLGFLALPHAMTGRAESLAALFLSLTPRRFEGRCFTHWFDRPSVL